MCMTIVSRDAVFHEGSRWNWEVKYRGEHMISIEDAVEESTGTAKSISKCGNNDSVSAREAATCEGNSREQGKNPQIAQIDGSPPRKT